MRIVLFTGKGGVGKTTTASATALRLADRGLKTLLLSTDIAHSLADALAVDLTGEPTEIAPSLWAVQIDTQGRFEAAWRDVQAFLVDMLARGGVDPITADELTVLPGVDEVLALLAVRELALTGNWDALVVDCAPTAETLRLLALPEALSGYLERLFPAHRRAVRGLLAGLAGAGRDAQPAWDRTIDALDGLAEQLTGLRSMLADHTRTSIRLVLTPERVVVAETRRTLTALALHGLHVDALVANRVLPGPPPSLRGPAARWLRERHAEQQVVLAELGAAPVPLRTVAYTAAEPTGVAALLAVAQSLYGSTDPAPPAGPATAPLLQVRRTAGSGTSLDSEFELVLRLPGVAAGSLDLARVEDELAVTAGGTRRMVALPSVLRRCTVTGARLSGDDLCVVFTPDPSVWLR
jgi:arsenite-transporting ATPase